MQIGLGFTLSAVTRMSSQTLLPVSLSGPAMPGTQISLDMAEVGDLTGLTIEWQRDAVAISGQSGTSYQIQTADLGRSLRVVLRNGQDEVVATSRQIAVEALAPQVTSLSRDYVVYDSGAAFGRAEASVPLSGTAEPGAVIEARAVPQESGTSTAWTQIAVTDAGGDWSGDLTVPRAPSWYVAEIRNAANPGAVGQLPQRVAAGHVIDLWGQSELHRAVRSTHVGVSPAPTISDPTALQVSWSNADGANYGTALSHTFLDGSNANLAGKLGALANMLAAERPGEKFHIVFQTLSATGARNLVDDSVTARQWSQDAALRSFALADHQAPGLAIQSWYNSDAGALNAGYGAFWMTAISGLNADGTPHIRGSSAPAGGGDMDHYFADIYDYGQTKWAIAGPHRFETASFEDKMGPIRRSLDLAFENPVMSDRAVRVLEPLSYQNPADDLIHPEPNNPDGTSRFMVQMGYGMLQGLGLVPWGTPEFDQAAFGVDGTYVEVWSSTGPVLTTRSARGQVPPAGYPSVYGFRFGTVLATETEIVGGRVRVYYNAARDPIPEGAVLTFGNDGIGTENDVADVTAQNWQDHPLVSFGQSALEGLPIRGNTPQSVLDVIPQAQLPADPNTNPNLLAVPTYTGTGTGTLGVFSRDPSWTVPGDGTFTESGVVNSEIKLRDNSDDAQAFKGKDLEFSFVLESPDAGTGEVLIIIQALGGASETLLNTQYVPARGVRNTVAIPLQMSPARRILQILLRRRNGVETTSGTYVFRDLTVKERL